MTLFSTVVDSRVEDLFYNGSESVFVTYAQSLVANTDTTVMSGSGERMVIDPVDVGDGKDFVIYENHDNGKMVLRTMLSNGKVCIVNDAIPVLKWKLEQGKKRVGPYECQKATTTFRCATYTVWFTTAIPISIGPGKLSGLPGLIVEATNERANVTYKLLTADYPTSKRTYSIAPPRTDDPVYSYKTFKKMEIVEADKLSKFIAGTAQDPQNPPITTLPAECLDEK